MEDFLINLISGTNPFIAAIGLIIVVQMIVIRNIHEKDLRITLMKWSFFFLMAALVASIVLPYVWENGWR